MTGNLGKFTQEPRKTVVTIEDRKEVHVFNRKWFHVLFFFVLVTVFNHAGSTVSL